MHTIDWPMPKEFEPIFTTLKYFQYYPSMGPQEYEVVRVGSSLQCYLKPQNKFPVSEKVATEVQTVIDGKWLIKDFHYIVVPEEDKYRLMVFGLKDLTVTAMEQAALQEKILAEVALQFNCIPMKPSSDSEAEIELLRKKPLINERNEAERNHRAVLAEGKRLRPDFPMPEEFQPYTSQLKYFRYYPEFDQRGHGSFFAFDLVLLPGERDPNSYSLEKTIEKFLKQNFAKDGFDFHVWFINYPERITISIFPADRRDHRIASVKMLSAMEDIITKGLPSLTNAKIQAPDENSGIAEDYEKTLRNITSGNSHKNYRKRTEKMPIPKKDLE